MSSYDFESYVFQHIKREFGCSIITQLRLDSGLRPDFVLECEQGLLVVDAKAKEKLTKADIEQVASYVHELGANYGIIFVADFTEVPESVEEFAILNAVEIEYTDWR